MPDISGSTTSDNGAFLSIPDGYKQFKGTITLSLKLHLNGATGASAIAVGSYS